MKRKEINNNPEILFAGRYCENSTSGPLQFSEGLFNEYSKTKSAVFIEYFFDGRKYSVFKKMFGLERTVDKNKIIIKAGIFRILPLLTNLKPEIIHLLTFERFAVFFYIYKIFFKVKIIYNSHGVIYYENSVLKKSSKVYTFKDKFCEKIFLRYSDRIIFPSELTIDIAEKYFDIHENKVLILPNIIKSKFFFKNKKINQSDKLKAVIMYKNKLNNSGIELLNNLLSDYSGKTEFFVIADDTLKLNLKQNNYTILTGKIPNNKLPEFYSDKDIFLSLNNYDTFSIATGEAMAAGLIPVATEQTGIARYIENGINGYKFDYNTPEKLTEIIKQIEKLNGEERNKISMNAAGTMEDLKAENMLDIYKTEYSAVL